MEENCLTKKRETWMEDNCATKKRNVSLEKFIPKEIYEQILVRLLDVKDLLRCKSVCKSWKSLISCRHFIKAHRNHCFNNNDNGHTRISQVVITYSYYKSDQKHHIVGSANGLVCVNTFNRKEFIVANPWTREENMVQQPLASKLSCWGFGYDSLTDDYKIVFGVKEGMNQTSFQVLSLKSNVWKHIGYVNYTCSRLRQLATLCNGALHWLMHREGQENSFIIISFDLSKEVFKEIPQPDDARYDPYKEAISNLAVLGIKGECLCVWRFDLDGHPIWIMQKYNVKGSWVTLGKYCRLKLFVFKYPSMDKDEVENDKSDIRRSTHDTWFLEKCMWVPATTVMQSLISPHPSRQ